MNDPVVNGPLDASRHPSPTWLSPVADADAAAETLACFERAFDGPPEGVWAAPGRVNLIGEHLDYNGGPVLPLALPHLTCAAVRPRSDGQVRLVSAASPDALHGAATWSGHVAAIGPRGSADEVDGWASYLAGVLWALRADGHDVPGVDVALTSSVPLGAGLSSSAALEGSLALAMADLLGLPTDDAGRVVLAQACVRAENEIAGAATGGMDQAASLRARAGHALLVQTATGATTQVPLDLGEHGLALLVIDTRAPHRLADGQYAARRQACERAAHLLGVVHLAEIADASVALAELTQRAGPAGEDADLLCRRVRHVVTEVARTWSVVAALRSGDLGPLGAVLDASHASLRDDYEVSSPELDVVTAAARDAGALGARMTGGGFGGSAIALIPADDAASVAAAVVEASTQAAHPEPAFLVAEASQGARRLA